MKKTTYITKLNGAFIMAQANQKAPEATQTEGQTQTTGLQQEQNGVKVTKEQVTKMGDMNISNRMRYLNSEGYTRAQIAKYLDKRYQHVRNVLITPLKGQG